MLSFDSELVLWHEEGAAACGRAGLSIGPTDRSTTTRSLVRQLVSFTNTDEGGGEGQISRVGSFPRTKREVSSGTNFV